VLARRVVEEQKRVGAFRKEHGNTTVGQITVDQVGVI